MHILLNFFYLIYYEMDITIHLSSNYYNYVLLDYGLSLGLGKKLINKFFTNV